MAEPTKTTSEPTGPAKTAKPAETALGKTAKPAEIAKPPETAKPAETAPGRTSDIVPGPGGVMTDEVGVVTGDLTLRTEVTDGEAVLHVQYKDAEEWYAVTGGRSRLADPADVDAVHAIAVALLHRPEG